MMDLPEECPFLPRCMKATTECRVNPRPGLHDVEPDHAVACYNPMATE
jgi:ABC-type dipeptide/oligopeptide/nickel transport system ATPase component